MVHPSRSIVNPHPNEEPVNISTRSLPHPCPAAAETAITIDDVVVVINSGRLKEKSFDPYTNVSTLMVGWGVGMLGVWM